MRSALVFAALLFVSCSSNSIKTESIQQVLSTDMALRMATEQCMAVGLNTQQFAKFERDSWWQRNGQWVTAADQSLVNLVWQHTDQLQEPARAVLSLELLEASHHQSLLLNQDWLGSSVNEEKCQRLFNRVRAGEHDIKLSDKARDSLAAAPQHAERTLSTAQTQAIAESASAVNARYRKYGRSLFLAEKSLQTVGCKNPNLALIRNSWPLEVYDATCSNEEYFLVKCEWGRCQVKH